MDFNECYLLIFNDVLIILLNYKDIFYYYVNF